MNLRQLGYFLRIAELQSCTRAANVDGGLQLTHNITVEIEEQVRPALVAEPIVRRYLAKGAR